LTPPVRPEPYGPLEREEQKLVVADMKAIPGASAGMVTTVRQGLIQGVPEMPL
jgi:hypothetical protein